MKRNTILYRGLDFDKAIETSAVFSLVHRPCLVNDAKGKRIFVPHPTTHGFKIAERRKVVSDMFVVYKFQIVVVLSEKYHHISVVANELFWNFGVCLTEV